MQGRIQDSQKGGGGAQIHCSEHDNCARSTRSGMQSMPNLGGSGGMPLPPGNFEKLDPLRLNLHEGTFNNLLLLLFQNSMHIAKQMIHVYVLG